MDSGMQRPRWQAVVAAMESIRRVREWEDMHENSKRFRECAAQINAEFRAEERQHAVEDLETDAEDALEAAEASEDEYMNDNDSFVSDDVELEDCEYAPEKEDEEAAEVAETN
jgi:DNA-nicking Smr family endonuclease